MILLAVVEVVLAARGLDVEVALAVGHGILGQLDIVHSVDGPEGSADQVLDLSLGIPSGLAFGNALGGPALDGVLTGELLSSALAGTVVELLAILVDGQLGGGLQVDTIVRHGVGSHVGKAEGVLDGLADISHHRSGAVAVRIIERAVVKHAVILTGGSSGSRRILGHEGEHSAIPLNVILNGGPICRANEIVVLQSGLSSSVDAGGNNPIQVGDGGLQEVQVSAVAVRAIEAGPGIAADEGIQAVAAVAGIGNGHLFHVGFTDLDLGSVAQSVDVVPVLSAGAVHLGEQGVLAALSQLVGADVAELVQVHVVLGLVVHQHDVLSQRGVVVDLGLTDGLAAGGRDGRVAEGLGGDGVGDNISLVDGELAVNVGVVDHIANSDLVNVNDLAVGQAQLVVLQSILVGVDGLVLPILDLQDVLGAAVTVVVDDAQALAVLAGVELSLLVGVEVLLSELFPAHDVGLVLQGGSANIDFAFDVALNTGRRILLVAVSTIEDLLHDVEIHLGDLSAGLNGTNSDQSLLLVVSTRSRIGSLGITPGVSAYFASTGNGLAACRIRGLVVVAVGHFGIGYIDILGFDEIVIHIGIHDDPVHTLSRRTSITLGSQGHAVTDQIVGLVPTIIILVVVGKIDSVTNAQGLILSQLGNLDALAVVEGNLVAGAGLHGQSVLGSTLAGNIGVVGHTHGIQISADRQGDGAGILAVLDQHLSGVVSENLGTVLLDVGPLVGHNDAGDLLQAELTHTQGLAGLGVAAGDQSAVLNGLGQQAAEEDLSDHLAGSGSAEVTGSNVLGDAFALGNGSSLELPALRIGELAGLAVAQGPEQHDQQLIAGDLCARIEGGGRSTDNDTGVLAVVDVTLCPVVAVQVGELALLHVGVVVEILVLDIAGGDTIDQDRSLSAVQGLGGLKRTIVKALENFQLVQHVDSSRVRIALVHVGELRGAGGSHEGQTHDEGQHQCENLLQISHGGFFLLQIF